MNVVVNSSKNLLSGDENSMDRSVEDPEITTDTYDSFDDDHHNEEDIESIHLSRTSTTEFNTLMVNIFKK
jgi:hypothetical protein